MVAAVAGRASAVEIPHSVARSLVGQNAAITNAEGARREVFAGEVGEKEEQEEESR